MFVPLLAVLSLSPPGAGVALTWEGVCAQESGARDTLDALLGEARSDVSAVARVSVEPVPAGFQATVAVEMGGAITRREFEAPDCDSLGDAVALIVAVAVDPVGAGVTVSEALHTEPAPPPRAVVKAPPPVILESALPLEAQPPSEPQPRARRPRVRVGLLLIGGGSAGLTTRIGAAVEGAFALDIGGGRIELAGRHRFAGRLRQAEDESVGADVAMTSGRASGCWVPAVARFEFPLCAGAEVGVVSASGFGLSTLRDVSSVWAAATPQFRPSFRPASWVSLGLDLQAPIALTRARFGVDDFESDLFQVGRAGFRFGLAVEFTFFDESRRRRARGGKRG